jgi:nucleotide-binding universal stress UspA family protein
MADVVEVSSRGARSLAAAERSLEAWRTEAKARSGVSVRAKLLVGQPVVELLRFAHDSACALLVVGTHGRSGLSRLVLGSVAESVIRAAPCPVVVAHAQAPAEEREDTQELML